MSNFDKNHLVEVSMEYPLYESVLGRYFIGQTPFLGPSAALINPIKSHRYIFLNTMTITNISSLNLSADFYLIAKFNDGLTSDLVSCTNTAIVPKPHHKGQIKYLTANAAPPSDGVAIFSRIVSPYSTLVVDGDQIILTPRQSIIIYLESFLPYTPGTTKIALGWEKKSVTALTTIVKINAIYIIKSHYICIKYKLFGNI